jgi:nucleotide-binding universal stress UspA family protein
MAYDPSPPGSGDGRSKQVDEPPRLPAARVSAEAREIADWRGDVSVRTDFVAGVPSHALVAAAGDADLIVIGTPHRYGSWDALAELSRHASCPILVVGDVPPASLGLAHVTALVGDDDSDDQVLAKAFESASRADAEVRVLHAWQPPRDGDYLTAELATARWLGARVARWIERYPQVGVIIELRSGPSTSVIRACTGEVSLLVLGGGRFDPATPQSGHRVPPELDVAIETRRHLPTLVIPRPGTDRRVPAEPADERVRHERLSPVA